MRFRPTVLIPCGTALLALVLPLPGQAQVTPPVPVAESDGGVIELPKFEVKEDGDDARYDATGMGSHEEALRSAPFANDLIAVDLDAEEGLSVDLNTELAAISSPSPAAVAAGEERLNLRGFPTPTLRNGFVQSGFMESLNVARTLMIQGAMVPVLGRAAPGGIQDFITARPQARARHRVDVSATTSERQRVVVESTDVLMKNRLWHRWIVDWANRRGPEEFVREQDLRLSGALTLKHSRTASSLFSVDYRRLDSLLTPGIPEYKTAPGQKVIGPWLPLAHFNASGPDAGVRRESVVVGAQFDGQLSPTLALRAAVEGRSRAIDQDRFTASQLVLSTGLFEGTREPRHTEQRQHALATHLELTARFRTGRIEHKLLTYAGVTWGDNGREERALSIADRNLLPLSVRRFDPAAPDYFLPAYSESLYSRIIADRLETARYTAAEVSDRMAFSGGRTVLTTGLRFDGVELAVKDQRVTAPVPHTRDTTGQVSYHFGANRQLLGGRLLAFLTTSTAFDPSTPVDARTGKIQDNETTLGYEGGVRGRARGGRLDYSASTFLLYNQHIARRNPLYDDPVFDLNQTQPQLVASGEERFTGFRAEFRYKLTETYTLSAKGTHLEAITTRSPALGPEVGKQLTRLPEDTAAIQLRFSPPKGAGLSWGAGLSYVGSYVAYYEDAKRAYLAYPGYGLVTLNAGYVWKRGPRQFTVGLSMRNALERDLLASHARVGAGRELGCSARVNF